MIRRHAEESVIAGAPGVGVAILLGLATGGQLFALMLFLGADGVASHDDTLRLLAVPVTFVLWGAFSYAAIRRFRSGTPRWKAGVVAVLSAAWSMGSWLLLWIAVFSLGDGSVI